MFELSLQGFDLALR